MKKTPENALKIEIHGLGVKMTEIFEKKKTRKALRFRKKEKDKIHVL